MSYENDSLRYPALWGNQRKSHDPERAVAFAECGHALCRLYAGLIPREASLIGYAGVGGYCSSLYFPGADFGINWAADGAIYELYFFFGGIIGKRWHTGLYDWDSSRTDLLMARQVAEQFAIDFESQLAAWERTHTIIETLTDLLERSAEDLYKSKVLGAEYFENLLLTI